MRKGLGLEARVVGAAAGGDGGAVGQGSGEKKDDEGAAPCWSSTTRVSVGVPLQASTGRR